MKIGYKKAVIEYNEDKDIWCGNYCNVKFVCNSLKKAKRHVDSVIGKKQHGKEAYLPLFYGFVTVTIVSELDRDDWVYIQRKDGQTDHIYSMDLFVINDKNTKSINEITSLQSKIFELKEKSQVLYSGLKKIF